MIKCLAKECFYNSIESCDKLEMKQEDIILDEQGKCTKFIAHQEWHEKTREFFKKQKAAKK